MNAEVDKKEFRVALVKRGINMKQFCKEYGLDYQRFNLSINGFSPLKENQRKAIIDFLNLEKEEK